MAVKSHPQIDELRRKIIANQAECKRLGEVALETPEYKALCAARTAYEETPQYKAHAGALERESELDDESPGGCHITCELCGCPLFEDSKVQELYSDDGGAMMCAIAGARVRACRPSSVGEPAMKERPSTVHRGRILALAAAGYSSGEIAETIGGGLTRSAVAGVCHRAKVPLGTKRQSEASKKIWEKRRARAAAPVTAAPVEVPIVPPHDLSEAARQAVLMSATKRSGD